MFGICLCLIIANLKQRGLAYTIYAGDFERYLPHVVDPNAYEPHSAFPQEMSEQLASYTNKSLEVWWCPELWKIRTTENSWLTADYAQRARSVGTGGYFKTVPLWSPATACCFTPTSCTDRSSIAPTKRVLSFLSALLSTARFFRTGIFTGMCMPVGRIPG